MADESYTTPNTEAQRKSSKNKLAQSRGRYKFDNRPKQKPEDNEQLRQQSPTNEKRTRQSTSPSLNPSEKMWELDSPITPRFYKSNRMEPESSENDGNKSKPPRQGMDNLNSEYLYYTILLKNMVPMMSRRRERVKVTEWVEKLASPAYQTHRLRMKRNKYMLKLCLNVINDELLGIFSETPPEGVLPRVEDQASEIPPARWQLDHYWHELIKGIPVNKGQMNCSAHSECGENQDENGSQPVAGALLDQEFRFFLYMARPYPVLLERPPEKARLSIWLQTLATIRSCACLTMKGIRNDYIQALLGYLQELRLTGPFQEFPPLKQPLPPLAELAKANVSTSMNTPLTDPSHSIAEEFLNMQPMPESGGFCYIAITGEPLHPTIPT